MSTANSAIAMSDPYRLGYRGPNLARGHGGGGPATKRVIVGFALIWHIWWLMILGLIGAYATFVVFAWRDVPEYIIAADEVARIDRANREVRLAALRARSAA